MKKLISLLTLLVWSVGAIAQVHTVGRGESLQSIAAKYHVSVAQLVEANPGADKLFYVGLKLDIPEQSAAAVTTETTETIETPAQSKMALGNVKEVEPSEREAVTDEDDPNFSPAFAIEYGFLSKPDGARGTNYTYALTVGANYYFMHRNKGLFAGARIGYNSANYNELYYIGRGEYVNQKKTAHFITLPVNIGYTLSTQNKKWAITPYAGIDFNFCVGGKITIDGKVAGNPIDKEDKFKKKIGIDGRFGVQLRLSGINIGASYVLPFNKWQKGYFGDDAYLAINIGFGF